MQKKVAIKLEKKGKGSKIMIVTEGGGIPVGLHMDSANPAEVKLFDETMATASIANATNAGSARKNPENIVADKAYDSNKIRKTLIGKGIIPCIPVDQINPLNTRELLLIVAFEPT